MIQSRSGEAYALVADFPIDAVRTAVTGFTLEGRSADRAEYRLDLHFDFSVDAKTRKVLGELLSQADVRVSRRGPADPLGPGT